MDLFLNSKQAFSLAKVELGSKWCLIGNELPVAIDFASVLNAKFKTFLIGDKNVANVHLGD